MNRYLLSRITYLSIKYNPKNVKNLKIPQKNHFRTPFFTYSLFYTLFKATNCVVDSRFALKIADFGLINMRNGARININHPVDAGNIILLIFKLIE